MFAADLLQMQRRASVRTTYDCSSDNTPSAAVAQHFCPLGCGRGHEAEIAAAEDQAHCHADVPAHQAFFVDAADPGAFAVGAAGLDDGAVSLDNQARALRASLERRFADCGLTLHPEKTKIVYCKDEDRRGGYPHQTFDFLGYTFRPRLSRRWRGSFGVLFSPAASNKALKTIRQTVRSWGRHERSDKSLDDLTRMFNSHIRGWINYYGRYYKSALYPTLRHIDRILARSEAATPRPRGRRCHRQ